MTYNELIDLVEKQNELTDSVKKEEVKEKSMFSSLLEELTDILDKSIYAITILYLLEVITNEEQDAIFTRVKEKMNNKFIDFINK